MLAPRATRAQRAHRLATITKRVSVLLDVLALLDSIDDVDAPSKKRRSTLVLRERRPFTTYIRPMLQDHTLSMRFRMGYDDFMALVDLYFLAIYLRCMSKKQTYAKEIQRTSSPSCSSSELRFAVVRRCPGA